jgi:hypothetical protein
VQSRKKKNKTNEKFFNIFFGIDGFHDVKALAPNNTGSILGQ